MRCKDFQDRRACRTLLALARVPSAVEERLTREEAIERFTEAGRKRPQPEVYLRADHTVPYRYVAQTLADASKGGLSKIAFVSEPER